MDEDKRPPAHNRPSPRSCIRGKQQGGADCSFPCGSALCAGDRTGERGAGLVGDAEPVACATDVPLSMRAGGRGAPSTRRWRDQPRCVVRRSRRCRVRAAARCRRPQFLARDAAAVRRRPRGRDKGSATRPAQIEESIAVGRPAVFVGGLGAGGGDLDRAGAVARESRDWSTGRRIRGHADDRRSARSAVDTSRADA